MCLKKAWLFFTWALVKQEDFRCLTNDDGKKMGGIMKTGRNGISCRYTDNMTGITGILVGLNCNFW